MRSPERPASIVGRCTVVDVSDPGARSIEERLDGDPAHRGGPRPRGAGRPSRRRPGRRRCTSVACGSDRSRCSTRSGWASCRSPSSSARRCSSTSARCITAGYGRAKRIIDVPLAASRPRVAGLRPPRSCGWATSIANRGPLFYRQERVGKGGSHLHDPEVPHHDARDPRAISPASGPPRTTRGSRRFGRLLRSTHLDELPQVINILQGRSRRGRDPAPSSPTTSRS